ncbi:MAG: YggU family protein [Betaproteobacteria bacterium]|nr:MAG: YggU family protein [Betaproteobacteria bacterium]TMH01561.1 MAG: YggU family protein [Betaproteobacteria bacterium]
MARSFAEGRTWRHAGAEASIVLEIHAQPGAKRSEVAGVHVDAVRIRIAAPAIEGKANAALLAFLAEIFGVPRKNVTLIRGAHGRRKTVRIEDPALRPDRTWEDSG